MDIDRNTPPSARPSRRAMVLTSIACAATLLPATAALAQEKAGVLTRDSVWHDPDIPDAGNPKGDLPLVEYFDYQCPYCKAIAPVLDQVVKEDGKIRLVLKDWPIFGPVSTYAAQMSLAAKYQNKYEQAHAALIGSKGKLTEGRVVEILQQAGIDVDKAKADLAANQKAIDNLLARNSAQAEALGFPGTPAFVIGKFRIPGVIDADGFKQAISDARAAAVRP